MQMGQQRHNKFSKLKLCVMQTTQYSTVRWFDHLTAQKTVLFLIFKKLKNIKIKTKRISNV